MLHTQAHPQRRPTHTAVPLPRALQAPSHQNHEPNCMFPTQRMELPPRMCLGLTPKVVLPLLVRHPLLVLVRVHHIAHPRARVALRRKTYPTRGLFLIKRPYLLLLRATCRRRLVQTNVSPGLTPRVARLRLLRHRIALR